MSEIPCAEIQGFLGYWGSCLAKVMAVRMRCGIKAATSSAVPSRQIGGSAARANVAANTWSSVGSCHEGGRGGA
eukprot:11386383-Prorocentrum_lima.AAC.1